VKEGGVRLERDELVKSKQFLSQAVFSRELVTGKRLLERGEKP